MLGMNSVSIDTHFMAIELTSDERNKLLGGPLSAAMAVMAVDMGIFSVPRKPSPWAANSPRPAAAMPPTP